MHAILFRITEPDINARVVSFNYFYAAIGTIIITVIMLVFLYA